MSLTQTSDIVYGVTDFNKVYLIMMEQALLPIALSELKRFDGDYDYGVTVTKLCSS